MKANKITFDTHEAVKILRKSGMKEIEAEAITDALSLAWNDSRENLDWVTKSDLKETELLLISNLKETENLLRYELKETENSLRSELKEVETTLRSEIKEVEHKLEKKIDQFEMKMYKFISKSIGFVIVILGGLQTLFHFLK